MKRPKNTFRPKKGKMTIRRKGKRGRKNKRMITRGGSRF